MAAALATGYGLTCVVTLGGAGCIAVTAAEGWRVPVLPIRPVDTTGAGDTFVGVLTAWLDGGADLVEALRAASVAARLQLRAGRRPDGPAAAGDDPGPPARPAAGHPAVNRSMIAGRSSRRNRHGSRSWGRGCWTVVHSFPVPGAATPGRRQAPAPGPWARSSSSARDGSPIGRHGLRFTPTGPAAVEIDIELAVKVAFVTVYRYRHVNRELWEGDRLVSFSSRTDDNGTAHRSGPPVGRLDPGGGRPGRRRGAQRGDADDLLAPPRVAGPAWIDSQNGRLLNCRVAAAGPATWPGRPDRGRGRFAVTGDLSLDLWYAATVG